MPAGRPSSYTEDLANLICDEIANGKTLLDISEDLDIPRTTINNWKDSHPEFQSRITRAREHQQDYFADRIMRMQASATPETWQMIQMQVRTIQWHMSKLHRKQYGENQEVNVNTTLNIERIIMTAPPLPPMNRPALLPAFSDGDVIDAETGD